MHQSDSGIELNGDNVGSSEEDVSGELESTQGQGDCGVDGSGDGWDAGHG